MKRKYEIHINGCDGSTVFEIRLTDDEFRILKKVCELSKRKSTYDYQPTMSIVKI